MQRVLRRERRPRQVPVAGSLPALRLDRPLRHRGRRPIVEVAARQKSPGRNMTSPKGTLANWRWCPVKGAPESWDEGQDQGCQWCVSDEPHPRLSVGIGPEATAEQTS